ncbi:hypothetical protein [Microbacterium sp. W4I20]|uniref:hypothetical protein n=1 Tax=Microbacterium sp. W4I20 TaxID=3042262 RepID=UPI00278344CB|nr:hypothetical protein [Microbacterium sp. W4I20]MDQ0728148.1 hypothetical protein [Microbacterium sp. W4I20]
MIPRPLTAVGAIALAAVVVLGQPVAAGADSWQTPTGVRPAATVPADTVPADTDGDDPAPAGVTWALQPAGKGAPDGRVSLRHRVDPGASIDESLVLTNFSAEPATFAVYASDGTVTGDGSFDLIPAGEEPRDGGAWVSLGAVEGSAPRDDGGFAVKVAAGAAVVIPVSIAVPSDATPGDHPAGIVAELVPDAATEVQIASRVGVRLHLRVSGDIVAGIRPEAVQASYEPSWNPFAPGTLTVRYDVTNTGNVRLGAAANVGVAGPFGLLAADRSAGELREILPGQASVAEVTLPVWPLLVAQGTADVLPSAVGDDEIESALDAASVGFTVWTIPWSQLALIAAAVLLFFAVRRARTRGKARLQARIDEAVASARAEQEDDAEQKEGVEKEPVATP